jgi:hypothetical protein
MTAAQKARVRWSKRFSDPVGLTTPIVIPAGTIFIALIIGIVLGFTFGYAKGQINMMDVMSTEHAKDIREESERCKAAITHAYDSVENVLRKTR